MSYKPKFIIILFLFIHYSVLNCYSTVQKENKKGVIFLMVYETNKSQNLKKSALYYSNNKWFTQKQDSLVMNFPGNFSTPDSLCYETRWSNPVYLTLKLYYTDRVLKSNTFYFSSGKDFYEVSVRDSTLKISPKPAGNNLSGQNSIQGLALIIQAILEMIIALMISKAFRLPHQIILMVLAANIAAFPLYMLNFPGIFLQETCVFITKFTIMTLIGLRKMPKYQILILALVLTLVGFGFKELFFFIGKIL